MIKTINSIFANKNGTTSKMFLRIIDINVSFEKEQKITIGFEYYTKCETNNMDIMQDTGSILMTFEEADDMTNFVANKHSITIESNFYESLNNLLPYLLLEYQKTNIKNGLTPFNIPVNDWEINS